MSQSRINLIWLIVFTLTLPVAVVVSTQLARSSFEKVRLRGQTVTVKGYAERPIVSDRAEWSCGITERHADRTAAYTALESARNRLLTYLQQAGFGEQTVGVGPVWIEEQYPRDEHGNRTNVIESYVVSQNFTIASRDVAAVTRVARDAGGLIAEGIELNCNSPCYLYTRLDELKLAMLSEAVANARQRADLLVSGSGDRLGSLCSASQGVFQITPAFSNEISSSGENDTTSIDKVIKAVVTVEYAIAE